MGKISQGVLGGFSGKIGNVIGGSWKGIDYMRIKPSSVANPRTPGQVEQRTKFALVLNFIQSMTDFIRVGFKLYSSKMSQFNSAMSYLLGNAITGVAPDFSLNYSKTLVSRGNLASADGAAAASNVAGSVEFSWNDNSGTGNAQATDKALLVVYNALKKETAYTTAGAERSVGAQQLAVPASFSGEDVECFIGFISADGSSVANSVYIGTVAVA